MSPEASPKYSKATKNEAVLILFESVDLTFQSQPWFTMLFCKTQYIIILHLILHRPLQLFFSSKLQLLQQIHHELEC